MWFRSGHIFRSHKPRPLVFKINQTAADHQNIRAQKTIHVLELSVIGFGFSGASSPVQSGEGKRKPTQRIAIDKRARFCGFNSRWQSRTRKVSNTSSKVEGEFLYANRGQSGSKSHRNPRWKLASIRNRHPRQVTELWTIFSCHPNRSRTCYLIRMVDR